MTAYCDRQRLTIDARVRLFCRICDAVQYAHGKLIVHRDLKPANIFVTATGDLSCWTSASPNCSQMTTRWPPRQLTRTGLRRLTPAYAAPEQLRNEPVSTATDVYTLGVILFELLTGTAARRVRRAVDSKHSVCRRRANASVRSPCSPVAMARRRIDDIARARCVTPRALTATPRRRPRRNCAQGATPGAAAALRRRRGAGRGSGAVSSAAARGGAAGGASISCRQIRPPASRQHRGGGVARALAAWQG